MVEIVPHPSAMQTYTSDKKEKENKDVCCTYKGDGVERCMHDLMIIIMSYDVQVIRYLPQMNPYTMLQNYTKGRTWNP